MAERARSYRRERLDESGLALARQRAEHVIVLMLENRSFDHLLGLLNHPKPEEFDRVQVGAYPNPYDFDNPAEAATVTDDGDPRLDLDPPHGHVSAMVQINRRRLGDFGMNGFVAAYAQKIAGKEHIPHIHWRRLGVLAACAVLPVAAAAHNLARRGATAGWHDAFPWLGVSALLVLCSMVALRLYDIPCVRRRYLFAGWTVASLFVGLSAEGLWRWLDEPRGFVSWGLVVGALVLLAFRYARQKRTERAAVPDSRVRELSARIMACMVPENHTPALAKLACDYAVCTRWHASVPGATWPNRNFAHAATSDESVDIELGLYEDRTIFETLDDQRRRAREGFRPTWAIYHHDTPQVIAFPKLWRGARSANWFDASQLLVDISKDELPTYSFVEPCHTGSRANSQHPGNNEDLASDDFRRGDMLIASIYNQLVKHPDVFERTMFIITYDEHGGLFDHVPPPKARHPERVARRSREFGRRVVSLFVEQKNRPFAFTHLGVRVPAVVVSPWVEPHFVDKRVYDHSSIVATVGRLWAPDEPPLTRRDAVANDLLHLIVGASDPQPAELITAYDAEGDDVVMAAASVGLEDSDLDVDPAALGEGTTGVLERDDFRRQLESLNQLVRRELSASAGNGLPPVPTAALFRARATTSRTVGPPLDDI